MRTYRSILRPLAVHRASDAVPSLSHPKKPLYHIPIKPLYAPPHSLIPPQPRSECVNTLTPHQTHQSPKPKPNTPPPPSISSHSFTPTPQSPNPKPKPHIPVKHHQKNASPSHPFRPSPTPPTRHSGLPLLHYNKRIKIAIKLLHTEFRCIRKQVLVLSYSPLIGERAKTPAHPSYQPSNAATRLPRPPNYPPPLLSLIPRLPLPFPLPPKPPEPPTPTP